MIIRDFTVQDKDALLDMVDLFYHSPAVAHPVPVAHFTAVFEEMCAGGSARVRGLLAEQEGVLAGFCNLSFGYSTEAGGPVVIIEELYVSPAFRGRGVGRALLDRVKQEYRGKAARLRLEVEPANARAQSLYEREGFEVLPYTQMVCEDW